LHSVRPVVIVFFGSGSFSLSWGLFAKFARATRASLGRGPLGTVVGRLAFSGQSALAVGAHAARGWATRVGPGDQVLLC
jgi:hypothetical protein